MHAMPRPPKHYHIIWHLPHVLTTQMITDKKRFFVDSVVSGFHIYVQWCFFWKLLCMIHTPYWLLMETREGASGLGITVAFIEYCNNVISPILPTLMEWDQWIFMCVCNYVMKFILSQIYFIIFEKLKFKTEYTISGIACSLLSVCTVMTSLS